MVYTSHVIDTSNLSKAHETSDSLSSSYSQVVLIYLYPFRRNSLLKSTPQPQIAKKTLNPYFKSSRSFKVIDVDTNKKFVTIACYDKQHVCDYLQPFLRYTSQ